MAADDFQLRGGDEFERAAAAMRKASHELAGELEGVLRTGVEAMAINARAAVNAIPTTSSSASARRTLVAPCNPQVPATGTSARGCSRTSSSCCSGVSVTIAEPESGYPMLAKIRPFARKSGWPMCSCSAAPANESARRRKAFEVMMWGCIVPRRHWRRSSSA
jgi:hypothetical protein